MKVFVASGIGNRRTQPEFWRAADGELVWVLPGLPPCPACGCIVSVTGVASGRSTPRFRVEDRADLDPEGFEALLASRWPGQRVHPDQARCTASAIARVQMEAAARFPSSREFNLREPVDRAIVLGLL